jgi:hypothetical protein
MLHLGYKHGNVINAGVAKKPIKTIKTITTVLA